MTDRENKTLDKFKEIISQMTDEEKQRLLDIGTGMVAMKQKINEEKGA